MVVIVDGLRADIANGDERALYLAWLLDVQCGVVDDDASEPARPVGLGRLSPALVDFVDIFGLDGDLVAAAASGDSTAPSDPSPGDIERWLAGFSPDEHGAWLSRLARGDGSVGAELMRRLRQHPPGRAAALPLRKAGELGASAEATAEKRGKLRATASKSLTLNGFRTIGGTRLTACPKLVYKYRTVLAGPLGIPGPPELRPWRAGTKSLLFAKSLQWVCHSRA